MAHTVVKHPARRRRRTGRWRVVVFLALVASVALVGVERDALAGILFNAVHARYSSTGGHLPQASATSTATATVLPDACNCTNISAKVPEPSAGIPQYSGQVILISLSQQWLWAYQDQRLQLASPVTTGMPQLPTPQGDYFVQSKETNITFYSFWPQGSPFYYSPEHINYAMYFRDVGYYIHDAPWRHAFGPGTEYPHTDPDGTWETGSHGCVNMPTPAAATLYAWAGVGARIIIVA